MQTDPRIDAMWEPHVQRMVEELERYPITEIERRLADFKVVLADAIALQNTERDHLACGIAAAAVCDVVRDRLVAKITPLN